MSCLSPANLNWIRSDVVFLIHHPYGRWRENVDVGQNWIKINSFPLPVLHFAWLPFFEKKKYIRNNMRNTCYTKGWWVCWWHKNFTLCVEIQSSEIPRRGARIMRYNRDSRSTAHGMTYFIHSFVLSLCEPGNWAGGSEKKRDENGIKTVIQKQGRELREGWITSLAGCWSNSCKVKFPDKLVYLRRWMNSPLSIHPPAPLSSHYWSKSAHSYTHCT